MHVGAGTGFYESFPLLLIFEFQNNGVNFVVTFTFNLCPPYPKVLEYEFYLSVKQPPIKAQPNLRYGSNS